MRHCAFIIVMLVMGGVGRSADAGTLWSQPGGALKPASSFPDSCNSNRFENTTLADNFHLATASSVSSITWWGRARYDEDQKISSDPFRGIHGFVITIYSVGLNGVPQSVLQSQYLAKTGITATDDSIPNNEHGVSFRYEATLTNPFILAAGDYAISIVAQMNDREGYDKWQQQVVIGDGDGYWATHDGANGWNPQGISTQRDIALILYGGDYTPPNIVPLPMPALLAFAGLAIMLPLRRRIM